MSSFVICQDCRDKQYPWRDRIWRYPCAHCAPGLVEHHQREFPGHRVVFIDQPIMSDWEWMQESFRRAM